MASDGMVHTIVRPQQTPSPSVSSGRSSSSFSTQTTHQEGKAFKQTFHVGSPGAGFID